MPLLADLWSEFSFKCLRSESGCENVLLNDVKMLLQVRSLSLSEDTTSVTVKGRK